MRKLKQVFSSLSEQVTTRRLVAFVLTVVMLGQVALSPLALPAVSAAGEPNANGTKIDTYVRTAELTQAAGVASTEYIQASGLPSYDVQGKGAATPNHITKQSIISPVYMRINFFWKESAPGTYKLQFDKPAGSTFQLGTDASTAEYVVGVTGTAAASTSVTLTLKSNIADATGFQIFYVISYNPDATPDSLTTDLTPYLQLNGDDIFIGDELLVTTACKNILYPALEYIGSGDSPNAASATFDSDVASRQKPLPTQVGRIGAGYSYSFTVNAYKKFLDVVPGTPWYASNDQTRWNAQVPKTLRYIVTLPVAANLKSLDVPADWNVSTATDGSGRTVLTKASDGSSGFLQGSGMQNCNRNMANNNYYAIRPTGFVVNYSAAPTTDDGAGNAAWLYEVKVVGTWLDDTPFEFSTVAPHIYSQTPSTASLSVTHVLNVDNHNLGGLNTNGLHAASGGYELANLALGDQASFATAIYNNGEIDLDHLRVYFALSGNQWDFTNIARAASSQTIGEVFDTMTISYSNGTSQTVSFNDSAKFTQIPSPNSYIPTYPTKDFTTWFMNELDDSRYVTEIELDFQPDFTLKQRETVRFGLEAILRSVTHSGSPIIAGTHMASTAYVRVTGQRVGEPGDATTSLASRSYPIYATQDDRPLADPSLHAYSDKTVLNSYADGDVAAFSHRYILDGNSRRNTNARVKNPSIHIVIPDYLELDAGSVTAELYSGTWRSIPTDALTLLGPGTSFPGVKIYRLTYDGLADASSGFDGSLRMATDWAIRANFSVLVPAGTPEHASAQVTTYLTQDGFTDLGRGLGNASISEILPDLYDLDMDEAVNDTLYGFRNTFAITVPSILNSNLAAQGDYDSSWKLDTANTLSNPLSDDNLAKMDTDGTLRFSIVNGTTNDQTSTLYIRQPVGSFVPTLKTVALNSVNLNTSVITPASASWYYTTTDSATLSTIASGNWVAFTDPSQVPAGVKAYRVSNIAADGKTRVDALLGFSAPATAAHGAWVRSVAEIDSVPVSSGVGYKTTSNYAGLRVVKPKLRINYYKDSVSAANLIGSSVRDEAYNLAITLAGSDLTANHPGAGFAATGVQQGNVPYYIQDGDDTVNVINVVYARKTYPVALRYFLGDATTAFATDTLTNKVFGEIIITAPLLDTHHPGSGYLPGMTGAAAGYSVIDGDNTIDIRYYKKTNLLAQVIYHLDSAGGTELGRSPLITALSFETTLNPAPYLDAKQPVGYRSGVAANLDWTIGDTLLNEFHVYYEKKQAKDGMCYIVDYYKDSEVTPFVSDTVSADFGDLINLTSALDKYRPQGYDPGQADPTNAATVGDSDISVTHVKVHYSPSNNLSATVRYYLDTVSSANETGTALTLTGLSLGQVITASYSQKNQYRPAGYSAGVLSSTTTTVTADNSAEVAVVYTKKTDLSYTVYYYLGSPSGQLCGQSAAQGPVTFGDIITLATSGEGSLDAFKPATGYLSGLRLNPAQSVIDAENRVVVYYPTDGSENTNRGSDYSYTITYWKDAIGTGTVLGSHTVIGQSFGAAITIAAGREPGAVDAFRPTGYHSGIVSGATIVADPTGAVNVIYLKQTADSSTNTTVTTVQTVTEYGTKTTPEADTTPATKQEPTAAPDSDLGVRTADTTSLWALAVLLLVSAAMLMVARRKD